MNTELYELLGVATDADKDAIKKAFRGKAKKAHPDKPGGDKETFERLRLAHDVLIDDDRRKLYDETGETGQVNKSIEMQKDLEIFITTFMEDSITDFIADPKKALIGAKGRIEEAIEAFKLDITKLENDFEALKDCQDMDELLFILEFSLEVRKKSLAEGEKHFANCNKILDQLDVAIKKVGREPKPEPKPEPQPQPPSFFGMGPGSSNIKFNIGQWDFDGGGFGGSGNDDSSGPS